MAFRQRTSTFRPQLSVRRVYETMVPRSEMKETPEAFLLHVYLPGFTKDRIKITLEGSSMVRIAGERPLQGNRWIRLDQTYPIPENSESETLEAKFEQSTLILKIQKKIIPQLSPKQEIEQKSPKHPSDDKPLDQEPKLEKVEETIPPPPTTPKVEENEEKKIAQKEDTSSHIPQEEVTNDNPKKGKEEFETKPTSLETSKTQIDENPQKGQEEVEPKPTQTTSTKEQLRENIVEKSVEEDVEKEKISKKEVKEEHEKPSEIEKVKEAEEPLALKAEEKEKESCCKTSLNKEGNGIRKLGVSSSQFVTRMAEGKWSNEERYLLENIGAAVLVIAALGAYVSYRFAS